MENSDSLISNLLEITNKVKLDMSNFRYFNKEFKFNLSEESYNKIHKGDIVLYNEKTKQYRIFKFVEKNDKEIIFQFENLYIKIFKAIDSE